MRTETTKTTETKGNVKFKDFTEIYIEDYCQYNLKENTIAGYKSLLKVVNEKIGDISLNEIDTYILQKFYNYLKDKGLGANTIRHYYVLINTILERAIKWDFIENNPNIRIDKPKLIKKEAEVYDYEDIKKLCEALEKEIINFRVAIILVLDSGIRREELNGLKWEDIDFEKREIRINEVRLAVDRKIITTTPKTEKSKRTIVVSEHTINLLKEFKEHLDKMKEILSDKWNDSGYVFVNDEGSPYYPDTISKVFKKILEKNNLKKITFHQLRHTSASILINENIDINAVSSRLGHANVSTTLNVYTHVINKRNDEIANIMNKILTNE